MSQSEIGDAMKSVTNVVFSKTANESQDAYLIWSQTYDKDTINLGANTCIKTGEMFTKHVRNPKSVLDIGAGTGLVVEYIQNEGYTCAVDILDANMGMLNEACKKDIKLRTVIRHFVNEDGVLPLKDEFYDVVTSAGSFIPNHIPSSALKGILNVLKKNGLFIFTTRSKSTESYKAQFDVVLQELLDAGKVELVDSEEFIHFRNTSGDTTSMVYVVKKL